MSANKVNSEASSESFDHLDFKIFRSEGRPVNIRSVSLMALTILATLFVLQWAKAVLIPLLLSFFISFSLNPIIQWLVKLKIPRVVGTTFLLFGLIGGMSYLSFTLHDEAMAMVDQLPQVTKEIRQFVLKLRRNKDENVLKKVQKAATDIEKVAEETSDVAGPTSKSGAIQVVVQKPILELRDYILGGSINVVAFMGQFFIVFLLVFFFLISGDSYKHKLIRISGQTLTKSKITLQILNDLGKQIQRYLFALVLSGLFVGVVTWLAFLWIGLEHAAVWGVVAGMLSAVPYIGPALVFAGTGIMGLLQFGTIPMALSVGSISLIITSIQGYLLLPWLISKTARISAVAVFVGILFWGWLWGFWGVLLAMPILIIIKTCCDHIDILKPVGALLGD